MSKIIEYLEKVEFRDKHFIGTIAFKNERISLPDGSKMALGIDDGHWVLIYQKEAGAHFQAFKYNRIENKIYVDKKPGGKETLLLFKKHLAYFFAHAGVEDLVTLLPPGS